MSNIRTAGSVLVGAALTALLPLPVVVGFAVFGWVTGQLVGASLPMWAVSVPLLACPLLGGLTAAALQGGETLRKIAFGGIAGGLGTTAVGIVAGFLLAVVALGMTPAHGQPTDFSQVFGQLGLYGAGGGVAVGATLGAVGGGLASLGWKRDRHPKTAGS